MDEIETENKAGNKKQKYPKTIKAIVADLRERGELDEEKWKEYKESWKLRNISFAVITVIAGTGTWFSQDSIFVFSIVMVLCFFFWWQVIKALRDQYMLYTVGKRTNAEITSTSLNRIGHGINTYDYTCKFTDQSNLSHVIKLQNDLSKQNKTSRPPIGDKIEIIYLELNPKISLKYEKYMKQQFDLKKKG